MIQEFWIVIGVEADEFFGPFSNEDCAEQFMKRNLSECKRIAKLERPIDAQRRPLGCTVEIDL